MAGKATPLGPAGERFAKNVQTARLDKRLTYTDVSALLLGVGRDISPLAVRRIEQGERKVDAQDIVAFSEGLGVPVGQLLLGPDEAPGAYADGIRRGMELSIEAIQNQRGAL